MATIKLPTQLAALADGQRIFEFPAATLTELFAQLDEVAPLVRSQLFEAGGQVRRFVGIFVDSKQVKSLEDGPSLNENSSVIAVMAVAGG